MVQQSLALTPQLQANITVSYNAYVEATFDGWDQWQRASDAGTSWRQTALAYVWIIAAVVTSVLWLLYVIYSSITWPPRCFHFTHSTLAVVAAVVYLILFLYCEATDWLFIWGVTDAGSDFSVLVLGWAKFGRSFVGVVIFFIVAMVLRFARWLAVLLLCLYLVFVALLIVMTVEISKAGSNTWHFCRNDDTIFLFAFFASISLLFSVLLAAVLLYQSFTIAIGTRRQRTAFVALQLFMAALQFGPMAILQSGLWWQGWGLVPTTVMVLSVAGSVAGLTGTLLSLLLVIITACCCRGRRDTAVVLLPDGNDAKLVAADGPGTLGGGGGGKVAPEPSGGSRTQSELRALQRSSHSFGYDPADPTRAMVAPQPVEVMSEDQMFRMQTLLADAAAASPAVPWQQPLPWELQQDQQQQQQQQQQLHSQLPPHLQQQHPYREVPAPSPSQQPLLPLPADPQSRESWLQQQERKQQIVDQSGRMPWHQPQFLQQAESTSHVGRPSMVPAGGQEPGGAVAAAGWAAGDVQHVGRDGPDNDPLVQYGFPLHKGHAVPAVAEGTPAKLPYDVLLTRSIINAYTQGFREGIDASAATHRATGAHPPTSADLPLQTAAAAPFKKLHPYTKGYEYKSPGRAPTVRAQYGDTATAYTAGRLDGQRHSWNYQV